MNTYKKPQGGTPPQNTRKIALFPPLFSALSSPSALSAFVLGSWPNPTKSRQPESPHQKIHSNAHNQMVYKSKHRHAATPPDHQPHLGRAHRRSLSNPSPTSAFAKHITRYFARRSDRPQSRASQLVDRPLTRTDAPNLRPQARRHSRPLQPQHRPRLPHAIHRWRRLPLRLATHRPRRSLRHRRLPHHHSQRRNHLRAPAS